MDTTGMRARVDLLPNAPGYALATVLDERGEYFASIRANRMLSFPQLLSITKAEELVLAFNSSNVWDN